MDNAEFRRAVQQLETISGQSAKRVQRQWGQEGVPGTINRATAPVLAFRTALMRVATVVGAIEATRRAIVGINSVLDGGSVKARNFVQHVRLLGEGSAV